MSSEIIKHTLNRREFIRGAAITTVAFGSGITKVSAEKRSSLDTQTDNHLQDALPTSTPQPDQHPTDSGIPMVNDTPAHFAGTIGGLIGGVIGGAIAYEVGSSDNFPDNDVAAGCFTVFPGIIIGGFAGSFAGNLLVDLTDKK